MGIKEKKKKKGQIETTKFRHGFVWKILNILQDT